MRRHIVWSIAALAVVVMAAFGASGAFAHQSGCHSAHTCPSDHHTYVWFDAGGQGWDCVEPGAPEYYPGFDTTPISQGGLTWYCHAAGAAPPPPPPPPPPPMDVTPPDTTISAHPSSSTTRTGASFSFISTEAYSTFTCTLDGVGAACTSPQTYGGLAVGPHSFTVAAKDAAGNSDPTPASFSWTISTAPDCTYRSQRDLPDSSCTPGAIFRLATVARICQPGYTKTVRNVRKSVKDEVYAEYGDRLPSVGRVRSRPSHPARARRLERGREPLAATREQPEQPRLPGQRPPREPAAHPRLLAPDDLARRATRDPDELGSGLQALRREVAPAASAADAARRGWLPPLESASEGEPPQRFGTSR